MGGGGSGGQILFLCSDLAEIWLVRDVHVALGTQTGFILPKVAKSTQIRLVAKVTQEN